MEREIDLRDILTLIRKRWLMLFLIPLAALLVSAFLSYYYIAPSYVASTTLMVLHAPAESGFDYRAADIAYSRQLVKSYGEIVKSRRVAERAIAMADVEKQIPYSEMQDKIDVGLVRDTEFINIKVTDSDPVTAAYWANLVTEAFIMEVFNIMRVENVNILDEAVPPPRPISPNIPLNMAVASVLGLMIALGLCFFLEYLDRSIKIPQDVTDSLQLSTLGAIPIISEKKKDINTGFHETITVSNPKSPAVEAYHTLRTNILFSSLDKPIRSILMTSPLPTSGKTTTVANLGVTIARTKASVLLVDVDLRNPSLHKLFNLENTVGLTSLLVDKSLRPQDVVSPTGIHNLSVLPSGPIPPNPSELIVSKAFAGFLEILKGSYDYILLDSPPVFVVTDPALLSRYVDGTIMVIPFGRVSQEMAQKARDQLQSVNPNILGVVLNKIPTKGYGNYYYYYQQHYGGEEEEKRRSFLGWMKRMKKKKKERDMPGG